MPFPVKNGPKMSQLAGIFLVTEKRGTERKNNRKIERNNEQQEKNNDTNELLFIVWS